MKKVIFASLALLLAHGTMSWADTLYLPGSAIPATNHALGGTATQSTTLSDAYLAGNGINGILSDFTHNEGGDVDINPFWQVVFTGDQVISEIILHNRDSCCGERLSDVTVTIRDALDTTDLLVSPVLNPANILGGGTTEHNSGGPATIVWDVAAANEGSPLSGGLVHVQRIDSTIGNEHNVLSLGEVQALADDGLPGVLVRDTNLALSGTTTQSTMGFDGVPERAVDGNTSGNWGDGSVTHTDTTDDNPWWQVDLGTLGEIDGISLYNRTDCCGDRLSDLVVDVLAADGLTVVATSGLLNPNNDLMSPAILAVDFTGQGVEGHFVRVTRMVAAGGPLSLAEVEVYGAAIPEPASFVLLAMAAIGFCILGRRRSAH